MSLAARTRILTALLDMNRERSVLRDGQCRGRRRAGGHGILMLDRHANVGIVRGTAASSESNHHHHRGGRRLNPNITVMGPVFHDDPNELSFYDGGNLADDAIDVSNAQ